jgi:hypothetical protein
VTRDASPLPCCLRWHWTLQLRPLCHPLRHNYIIDNPKLVTDRRIASLPMWLTGAHHTAMMRTANTIRLSIKSYDSVFGWQSMIRVRHRGIEISDKFWSDILWLAVNWNEQTVDLSSW